jgi:hypothetical protein
MWSVITILKPAMKGHAGFPGSSGGSQSKVVLDGVFTELSWCVCVRQCMGVMN